ncbi:LCP family protein [Erysipelothrix anatis]|uniref:LCP family protein n=1 Tax=Erysipelothrix anatis TaxID=2683713 RepID=UPI00135B220B|nr:LCP family protein [Erysipelothrix anatis]
MKNKSKKEIFLVKNSLIIILHLVVSLVSTYYIYNVGILPTKYLVIVLAFIWTMFTIFAFSIHKSKGKVNGTFKIISLLLTLLLLLGSVYVMKGNKLLNLVTGADIDTHVISIIVSKDSSVNSLEELSGQLIGVNTTLDKNDVEKGVNLFKKDKNFDVLVDEYTSYENLNNDLLNAELPAIMISESHRGLIQEINPTFDEETRVIGYVSYQVESKVSSSDVNVMEDTYSIFLTGIDTYGPVSTVSRSDVNMIITVNPKENQILLTSIPRDYFVELGTIGQMDKLTHAGIYGVGESVSTLEKLLDMKIDFYLKVNFSSVEEIVDSIGGVEVYSKNSFTTRHQPKVQINQGMNSLNGAESLAFVRERYALPDGDNGRVQNQQELIVGMINKASSPAVLVNFDSIVSSVGDSMQLSMSDKQLKSIIRAQVNSGASWDVQKYQLVGTGSSSSTTYSMPGWNLYVMEPDVDSVVGAKNLISDMEKGNRISVN